MIMTMLARAWRLIVPEPDYSLPVECTIDIQTTNRGSVTIIYEKHDETFVWRYQKSQTSLALQLPGQLAAGGGVFEWQDAMVVTAAMRSVVADGVFVVGQGGTDANKV